MSEETESDTAPSAKCKWCPTTKLYIGQECSACYQAARRLGRCEHGHPKRRTFPCGMCPALAPVQRRVGHGQSRSVRNVEDDEIFQSMSQRYRELVDEGDALRRTPVGLRMTQVELNLLELRAQLDAWAMSKAK